MEIIETDIKSLSHIIHVSDIHIRKRERHTEYQIVFDRLYNDMRKIVSEYGNNVCIVITGDIMHDKSELVPESINMLKKFLLSLSDIMEVVLIIGNHDINIFNIGSMDALTPIVSDLYTINKIHLLTENKNYVFGETGIVFGVTTLWAKSVTPPTQGDHINIALYHGMLHGCTLDNGMKALSNGFSTNSSYFNVSDFAGYDAVLLGDIHKHQYLNTAKTVAYAGSLIQQKRDEDLLEHGYILWDVSNPSNVSNLTSRFIRIRSDYGMVEIRTKHTTYSDDTQLTEYPNDSLPLNLDIKIVYTDSRSKMVCKDIYSMLSNNLKRNLIKTSDFLMCDTDSRAVSRMPSMPSMSSVSEMDSLTKVRAEYEQEPDNAEHVEHVEQADQAEQTDQTDQTDQANHTDKTEQIGRTNKPIAITSNDAVLSVMMGYYNSIHKHEKTDRNQITKQIGSILKDIGYNYESDVKNIRLKSIEFNNMLIYLAGNRVDFTLFDKIVGLNASNYQGKSSFIDIVLYAIYGQCSRGKRFDMLNILSTKMSSRIVLDVNKVEYIILRSSYINSDLKRDLKESITVWENDRNITADDRVKTQQIIEQKICTYTDMLNNSFILQKNGHSFTDLTDRQKKDLLCKMARLDVFDRVLQHAKSKHFSVSQSLSKLIKKLEAYKIYTDDSNTNIRITENNRSNTIRVFRSNMVNRLAAESKICSRLKLRIDRKTTEHNALMQQISSMTTEEKYSSQNAASLKTYDRLRQEIHDRSIKLISYMDAVFADECQIRSIKQDMIIKLKQIDYAELIKRDNCDVLDMLRIEVDLLQMSEQIKDAVNRDLEIKRNDLASQHKMYYPLHTNLSAADARNKIDEYQSILSNDRAKLEHTKSRIILSIAGLSRLRQPNPLHDIVSDRIKQIEEHRLSIQRYAEQIDQNIRTIEGHNAVLNSLSSHQYNPSCAQCMSNPATKQILNYSNSIEQISQQNQRIMTNIEQANRDISDLTYYDGFNCIDEYNIIKQIPESVKKLEARITIDRTEHKDIEHSIITAERDLADYVSMLKHIESNKIVAKSITALEEEIRIIESRTDTDPRMQTIQSVLQDIHYLKTHEQRMTIVRRKIAKTRRIINTAQSEITTYSADFIFESITHDVQKADLPRRIERLSIRAKQIKDRVAGLRSKVDSSTHIINTVRTDLAKFDDLTRDIEKETNKRIVLDSIKSLLDKSGLVDRILLRNIIPYLQTRINNILSSVGHYKIRITYVNRSVNIYKDGGSNSLNISMSSGYESYLLDLVFRLALVQINNHVRTDFLIIDEGFNACDDEHKHNIKDLLEYMRSYYSWILIISHDPFIKSFYDQSISIQSVEMNGVAGSYITNIIHKDGADKIVKSDQAVKTVKSIKSVKSVKSVKTAKPVKSVK